MDELNEGRAMFRQFRLTPRLRSAGFQAYKVRRRQAGRWILDGVSLEVPAGEVHCLLGREGAGKSAFLEVVAGRKGVDEGELYFANERYQPGCPAMAWHDGVHFFQHNQWAGGSAREVLGAMMTGERFWVAEEDEEVEALLAEAGIDPEASPRQLGPVARHRLAMAIVVASRPRLLLLDEPMAGLPEEEQDRFFDFIGRLAYAGVGVLYATRHWREVVRVGHQCSLIERGRVDRYLAVTDLAPPVLAPWVKEETMPRRTRRKRKRCLLLKVEQGEETLLDVHEGEVIGFHAGEGSQQFFEIVAGQRKEPGWKLWRAEEGVAMVGKGRRALMESCSVEENLTLSRLGQYTFLGLLMPDRQRVGALHWMEAVRLWRTRPEEEASRLTLSQCRKIEMARVWQSRTSLVLLEEPTSGVDVETRRRIHEWVDQLAREGRGVLYTSGSRRELKALCDRVVTLPGALAEGGYA